MGWTCLIYWLTSFLSNPSLRGLGLNQILEFDKNSSVLNLRELLYIYYILKGDKEGIFKWLAENLALPLIM